MTSRRLLGFLLASLALFSLARADSNVVSGSADVVATGIHHPNGNIYDQVLLTGQTATLQTVGSNVLRCSFLDPDGDIVQCEFSGPGQFTITLDPDTYVAAAPPAKYNQPGVSYVTGKPTVTITGNTADTYVNIFSVGKANAVNQALFPDGQEYDGVADVQLLSISGPAMGAIFNGNVRYSGSTGMTGIFAPNTDIVYRAILQDLKASGTATPVLEFGSGSTFSWDSGSVLVGGGDLSQPNGASIDITSGDGNTLASIVTVANIRSDGTALVRATISGSVTWISGGSGTLLIDGQVVFNSDTGETSGTFSANFSDLLSGTDSPFSFDGNLDIEWYFSGENTGTWWVQTTSVVNNLTIKAKLSGTYTYAITDNGHGLSFTLNYNQLTTDTGFGAPLTVNITSASNPPLPKSIAMTATTNGDGTGTYNYTLTMSDGSQTTFSGTYNPDTPLSLPTGG
ncbi:MAG TPA: hypothetical protein VHE13_15855 [Opitutus sp.]|nr:hypothetical protein [Opitutus sp.]